MVSGINETKLSLRKTLKKRDYRKGSPITGRRHKNWFFKAVTLAKIVIFEPIPDLSMRFCKKQAKDLQEMQSKY
jgi:hypothetical protein